MHGLAVAGATRARWAAASGADRCRRHGLDQLPEIALCRGQLGRSEPDLLR
jgi:hypothetical protein